MGAEGSGRQSLRGGGGSGVAAAVVAQTIATKPETFIVRCDQIDGIEREDRATR